MFLTRYPMALSTNLRREMSNLLDEVFGDWPNGSTPAGRGFPALNVWEDAEHVYAEAELPGMKLEDIEVLVVGDELTLKGSRAEATGENATYHRRERGAGEFARTITLPYEIDSDRVEATLKNGVLTVTMPKAEAARPRKIEIKAS